MEHTRNNHSKLNKLKIMAAAGALGLSACVSEQTLAVMKPLDRFEYDYTQHYGDCLSGSAYDPSIGNRGKASVNPPSVVFRDGVLTITPADGVNSLHVTNFNQSKHRVTPVSPQDQAIFDAYGCVARSYE